MTPEQIKIVQDSWEKITPMAEIAATLFYNKLFTMDPSLRQLFPTDLTDQKKKLLATLSYVVYALSDLQSLVPQAESLGYRHSMYGVKPAHYITVGEALLSTLQTGLAEEFTSAVHEAWGAAYALLSSTMQNGRQNQGAIYPV